MSKFRSGRWREEEDAFIKDIPYDPVEKRSKLLKKAVEKLTKKFKVVYTYEQTYQRWLLLWRKASENEPSAEKSTVKPMQLEFVDEEIENSRLDSNERLSLQKGIDLQVPKLQPFKGAFNIKSRYQTVTKEYVAKHYPDMIFGFKRLPGTKMVKVYRKA